MRYIVLIYHAEQSWSAYTDDERQQIYGEYRDLIEDLQAQGKYVAGDELQPTDTACSVKVRDGERMVTDGPFAETREQVGGFFLVDVKNQEEAISIAGRIPSARRGTIEVRPVVVTTSSEAAPQTV